MWGMSWGELRGHTVPDPVFGVEEQNWVHSPTSTTWSALDPGAPPGQGRQLLSKEAVWSGWGSVQGRKGTGHRQLWSEWPKLPLLALVTSSQMCQITGRSPGVKLLWPGLAELLIHGRQAGHRGKEGALGILLPTSPVGSWGGPHIPSSDLGHRAVEGLGPPGASGAALGQTQGGHLHGGAG